MAHAGTAANLPLSTTILSTKPAVNSSPYYRAALGFIALVSIPFAFTQRPLLVVVIFTVIGSLFIPFLAGTLLYLNNRIAWRSALAHNRWTTNAVLILVLLVFMAVAAWEIPSLFR